MNECINIRYFRLIISSFCFSMTLKKHSQ
uniref:Uncharacterized protein n=1 Tax=Arundo donax TaxID=35708 RepID=A0A0A9HYA9_ARUDO